MAWRKYKTNNNFFKKWTPEMSYVLGLIISDGCISHDRIRIMNNDKILLEKTKEFMNIDNPIYFRTYKSKNRVTSHGYVLQINNKKNISDLKLLGVTERKSKTINLPNIPKKYFSYFLQGLIDGDGSVYQENYNVTVPINRIKPLKYKTYNYTRLVISIYSASKIFLIGLRKFIIQLGFKIHNISEMKKHQYSSVYKLSSNTKQAEKIGSYIYKNNLVESRKFNNFQTALMQ